MRSCSSPPAAGTRCLPIAGCDFALVERIDGLQPLTIAVAAGCFATALRYRFWPIAIMAGSATACFAIAALL